MAGGVGGKNLVVLLDSDKEGSNARTRLNSDLFTADSRIVLLGDAIGRQKATIEDMVDLDTYGQALNVVGYALSFIAEERGLACNADACTSAFRRLNLGDFDHVAKTKAALSLIDEWIKHPDRVPNETMDHAKSLFRALNGKFSS